MHFSIYRKLKYGLPHFVNDCVMRFSFINSSILFVGWLFVQIIFIHVFGILWFAFRQGWFLRILDFSSPRTYSMGMSHVMYHISLAFEFSIAIMNFTVNIFFCQLVNFKDMKLNSAFIHDFWANSTSSFWRSFAFGSLVIVRIIPCRWCLGFIQFHATEKRFQWDFEIVHKFQ